MTGTPPSETTTYRYARGRELTALVAGLSAVSGWRAAGNIAWQWLAIGLAMAAALWTRSVPVYLLAVLVIASRQHALGLLVHEGAHYLLFRNRALNDLASDFFCAHPLGGSTALYRDFHFQHHRHTNSEKDPEVKLLHHRADWQFPKTKAQIAGLFLRDLLSLNWREKLAISLKLAAAWSFYKKTAQGGLTARERVAYTVHLAVLVLVLALTSAWIPYALLWLVPSAVAGLIFRLRVLGEHVGVADTSEVTSARSVRVGPVERALFAPLHSNLHLEHHMLPTVPCFNLPAAHAALMQRADFRDAAHLTDGYAFGKGSVLAELTRLG